MVKWSDLEKEEYEGLPYTARIALEQSKYKEPNNKRDVVRAIINNEYKGMLALLESKMIENGLKKEE